MDWHVHYLKVLKEYARDYVLENTGLKVLALLITAVLWLSVASRPINQMPITNVPIEFANLSQSPSLTVSKYDTLSARVFVEGPRDVLDGLRPSQLTIVADMTGVEPGVRVIPLKLDPSRLPASVKLRDIEPRSVRVTVERVVDKEVPVKPRFEGQPAPGFELVGWQITPSTVRITGAESNVRDLKDVSTETVSVSDRTEGFSERVAIDIGQPNLSISDDGKDSVMLVVNISEVQKEKTFDGVQVSLLNAPRGSRAIPPYERVVIRGAASAVDEMTASDLSVVVDYQGPAVGRNRFAPEVVVLPSYADRVAVTSFEPKTIVVK